MKIAAGILAIVIFNFPVSLNYWAGLVALFAKHPTYWQIYTFTGIILCLLALLGKEAYKTLLGQVCQCATLICFLAWLLRLVGIMPNAPF